MKPQGYWGKKDARFLPKDQQNWQEAAARKMAQTGSMDQAEKYANHSMKAAIHRRQRKKDKGKFDG